VLIGGAAMQVHGHVRTTQDVDVVAAWTLENMRALAAALEELSAALRGVGGALPRSATASQIDQPLDRLEVGGALRRRACHGPKRLPRAPGRASVSASSTTEPGWGQSALIRVRM
jgi:hypothetical protein